MTVPSKNSLILRFLISLVIAALSMVTPVAQAEMTRTDLGVDALKAFNDRHWGDAHRMYAELLSVDGTSLDFQWRYAVTLLHDVRTRKEGFQRLAELRNDDELNGEAHYWWGLSLMKMGKGDEAVKEMDKVILEFPKKHPIHQAAARARTQAMSLPEGFPRWHTVQVRDEIHMSWDVWHQQIPPPAQTSRWIKLPAELQGKADRKMDRASVMLIDSRSERVFFHSWGAKGRSGADVWTATMDEQGRWVDCEPLSSMVNSPFDDMHPVWDADHETLYFSSDRPGGCGGFDIWRSEFRDGIWGIPEHVGPALNSVHQEWAWIPCASEDCVHEGSEGWLLTDRGSEFDMVQGLDILADIKGSAPVPMFFEWNEGHPLVNSWVTLTDAQTGEEVMRAWIGADQRMPALMLPAGRAFQMTIDADHGIHATGMMTVPDADWPYAAKQAFRLAHHEGSAYVELSTMQVTQPQENLALWGWESLSSETPFSEAWRVGPTNGSSISSFGDAETVASHPSWLLDASAWENSMGLVSDDGTNSVRGSLEQAAEVAQDAFEEASGVALVEPRSDRMGEKDVNANHRPSQEAVSGSPSSSQVEQVSKHEEGQPVSNSLATGISNSESANSLIFGTSDLEPHAEAHMSEVLMSHYVGLLRKGAVSGDQMTSMALPLRTGWVLGTWHRNRDDEGHWNPESVHAMLMDWPDELSDPWEAVRLDWSAQLTKDREVISLGNWTNGIAIPMMGDEAVFQAGGWNDSLEVPVGEEGLQVGWFRSQPQLGPLPPGTKLHRQPGVSGISRWVLIRETDELTYARMAEWLMAVGVTDAFEVLWDGQTWGRSTKQQAAPSQATGSHQVSAGDVTQGGVPPTHDGEWPHGEPVPLGELQGTWFAVQLGAFRGFPKSDWIELAGERLVFERFDDGLSRWYAAVHESREFVRGAWTRFRQQAQFSDAFMVVLREGQREAIGVMDDEMTYQGNAPLEGKNPASYPGEDEVVEKKEDFPKTENITWRVDIAKYFGTVPGQEVAVLLLRSADWGVRSWTVKGQTTYCSRSFSDWEEAQLILAEVRQEGFEGATLVQE
ncbi:MAG: hypothetical protein O3B70_00135 [Bacteroidetes bacterium]|nr:hypothetical protein [Bacteroidota bacterium]